MQTCNEKSIIDSDNENIKRAKSATRFSKRMPTFVVAYSVQESYDDPSKSQKLHNKRSPQTSKSITPSISSRTITLEASSLQRLTQVIDVPETSNDMRIKIATADENQYGDVGKVSPETSVYVVDDIRTVDNLNIQPQIIFDSTKRRTPKGSRKKPKSYNHAVKIRNIHFKSKKNNITTKLERYCLKAKQSCATTARIQKGLYSESTMQIVSRSRILRKVFAKSNLLDDSCQVADETSFISTDSASLTSSPSTVKRSDFNSSSQNTLIRIESTTSSRTDDISILNNDSITEITSEVVSPYKADVINVGVAVTYSKPMPNNMNHVALSDGKERFIYKESLTSTETVIGPSTALTDNLSSEQHGNANERYLNTVNLNASEMSNRTLIAQDKESNSSELDTYVIARTSSDFHRSSLNDSIYIETSNSDDTVVLDHIPTLIDGSRKSNITSTKLTLLDTVKKIGMFPEITPSTSSACNVGENLNDVLITSDRKKPIPVCKSPKSKGDQSPKKTKNFLRKFFEIEKHVVSQKNINLPNEAEIKSMIDPEKQQKRSCSEESRNVCPSTVPELWDKLVLVLDLAVKRLEETLAEKIIMEIKKSLTNTEQQHLFIPSANLEIPTSKMINEIMGIRAKEETKIVADKENYVERGIVNIDSDKGLQCDLVQNKIIDQLMLKLSTDTPMGDTSVQSDIRKPELIKDYFEVLKPPAVQSKMEEVITIEDTVTASTVEPEPITEKVMPTNTLKVMMKIPLKFFMENFFVVTSVPTFFIVLFITYSIIVLIVKT